MASLNTIQPVSYDTYNQADDSSNTAVRDTTAASPDHLAPAKPEFRTARPLERLPLELLHEVLSSCMSDNPRSVLATASVSRALYGKTARSGVRTACKLILKASGADRNRAAAARATAEVLVSLRDGPIQLSSAERLAIIRSIKPRFLTSAGARDLIDVIKLLAPADRGDGLSWATCLIRPNFAAANADLFAKMSAIVPSLRSDGAKATAMTLLNEIRQIPLEHRIELFDGLAPEVHTIKNEGDLSQCMGYLRAAIRHLPREDMLARFVTHLESVAEWNSDTAKARTVAEFSDCLKNMLPEEMLRAFNMLVEIARGIKDECRLSQAKRALEAVCHVLPASAQADAATSLKILI